MIILVMGVSGSGKSTIGKLLADSLDWKFSDADHFHSPQNIAKMRRGIPLDDGDRLPWLQDIQAAIKKWLEENQNVVLACSALKISYRQYFFIGDERIKLVYLHGSFALINKRLQERHNHFMSENLLKSQFDTLEEPTDALCVDISPSPEVIVENIRESLQI
ncbi:MAG: gluconokinase [Pelatocladus maniniholoensis HA4357-MV3]|jgi:gluconokinase|uniref:Gluconokinase n=1 Tax=Pelatocladus maniniholoensis HA4357-MV3 TaxID=1117104 RepID=A0A9E3HCZ1_9NOST|nr:gluconokinase [Pelatocladus maniniholoensis HA4357-MV3]